MRLAARTDQNHKEIVNAFRKLGASVLSLASMGRGVPDLLVAKDWVTWLIEVKTLKGKETFDQVHFAIDWKGKREIVRTIADVESVVKRMQQESRGIDKLLLNS